MSILDMADHLPGVFKFVGRSFSFNEIVDVATGTDKVYAASENAVFSFDLLTNEINTITTIEGLSGQSITTIRFSEQFNTLLIGYENGLIELYFSATDQVLSVVDILERIAGVHIFGP